MLNASLAKFKKEQADATSRNISHSRPASSTPARVSTPQPSVASTAASDAGKRSHDTAFSNQPSHSVATSHELLTNMSYARSYLKSKHPQTIAFDDIIRHLSLPVDAEKNVPLIRQALEKDDRVDFIPKGTNGAKHASFRYRPKVPVSNGEELKDFLARKDDARGIAISDLKDGWPDCVAAINQLENEGAVLVIRQKKENFPKTVYADSPSYHIHVDNDFRDFWLKTKIPASESEIRSELEKAGITPTSQVKDIKKGDMRKRDRKRPNRRGGKTTNQHMLGILKEYTKR